MAPLFLLARATRSDAVGGAAWGALAHLARDLSLDRGVPLLQPFHAEDLRVPYPAYALALAGLAVAATTR